MHPHLSGEKTEVVDGEAANLVFGLTLSPRLLIGTELFGMVVRIRSAQLRGEEGTETFSQLGLGPTFIFFPFKLGPYLKASIYGQTLDDWNVDTAGLTNTQEKFYGFGSGVGGGDSFGVWPEI